VRPPLAAGANPQLSLEDHGAGAGSSVHAAESWTDAAGSWTDVS
jgi:hypothetical protein